MNVSSASAMSGVLIEGRIQREKAADERAATRLRDAKSALATLKQRTSNASDQKKAAAKQRVDQIKARLQMLKMSSPVDPKILAQLARELKAAVRSYASAGGSPADLGAMPTQGVPASSDAATADTGVNVDESATAVTAAGQPGLLDAKSEATLKTPELNPYLRLAREVEDRFADASRHAAANQADRDFLTDVRRLANQIKSLAKPVASQKTDPTERHASDEAEQAAGDTLKALSDAGQNLNIDSLSMTV